MPVESSEKRALSKPETTPERILTAVRSSITLKIALLGLFLVLVGGVAIPFGILDFGGANDVLAGMFGIWGGTLVFIGVAIYTALLVNKWRSEQTAYSVDEQSVDE